MIAEKLGKRIGMAILITGKNVSEYHKHVRGIGDLVELAAKPFAKAIGMDCLDEQGKLKPESGCAKRRDAFNKVLPLA